MRFAVPFALASGGSAAIVASMTRWSLLGPLHGPLAIAVGVIAGAALGLLVARTTGRRYSALGLAAAMALLGPISGFVIAILCQPSFVVLATVAGAALAIMLLPVLLASVWLLRRRSVRHDTRAPLRMAGLWLTVASAIGITLFASERRDFWTAAECVSLARVPLVLALVGCAMVFAIAVVDGFAEDQILELDASAKMDAAASWWLTHVGTPRPNARVGDLERAHGLLAASRQSRIAIVLALIAVTPTLLAYARFAAEAR
jgi:hypothetical protein